MKTANFFKILPLFILLAACGGSATKDKPATPETKVEDAGVKPTGEVNEVQLNSDDAMKYDKSEIKVKEGQTVKLTLTHTGTMPKTSMGHNFVLLQNGVAMDEFGMAAGQLQGPDYILTEDLKKKTIAFTEMIGGGESTTIEFLTPKKGTYDYICSFPGHFGMMKGVFIVE